MVLIAKILKLLQEFGTDFPLNAPELSGKGGGDVGGVFRSFDGAGTYNIGLVQLVAC